MPIDHFRPSLPGLDPRTDLSGLKQRQHGSEADSTKPTSYPPTLSSPGALFPPSPRISTSSMQIHTASISLTIASIHFHRHGQREERSRTYGNPVNEQRMPGKDERTESSFCRHSVPAPSLARPASPAPQSHQPQAAKNTLSIEPEPTRHENTPARRITRAMRTYRACVKMGSRRVLAGTAQQQSGTTSQ
uniref:Uncharacterized protein n=1 Tax=Mycena chlorophos TaxID=658473 RepID=A0ABQ0L325_MYCCL|nr:predicted protein [Mycena chlorophos]